MACLRAVPCSTLIMHTTDRATEPSWSASWEKDYLLFRAGLAFGRLPSCCGSWDCFDSNVERLPRVAFWHFETICHRHRTAWAIRPPRLLYVPYKCITPSETIPCLKELHWIRHTLATSIWQSSNHLKCKQSWSTHTQYRLPMFCFTLHRIRYHSFPCLPASW